MLGKALGYSLDPATPMFYIYRVAAIGGATKLMGEPLPPETALTEVFRRASELEAGLIHFKAGKHANPVSIWKRNRERVKSRGLQFKPWVQTR